MLINKFREDENERIKRNEKKRAKRRNEIALASNQLKGMIAKHIMSNFSSSTNKREESKQEDQTFGEP